MFETMFRMDGKVAVVTGAAFGIGRSFALGLAEYGAHVICIDRDKEGWTRPSAHSPVAPQRRGDRWRCRGREIGRDELGRDRGQSQAHRHSHQQCRHPTNPVRTHEFSVEDWDRLMAVNLRGVFLTTRQALRLMLPGPGSIINIASIAGLLRLLAGLSLARDQLFDLKSRRHRLHQAGRRGICE